MTSFYSFLVAVIWFNIAMLFVAVLSRRLYFLVKYSTSVLLVCAALGIMRMLLPLDFSFAYVIRSFEIMPPIRDFFEYDVVPGPEYLKLGTVIISVWVAGTVAVTIKTICQLTVENKARKQYVRTENEQVKRVCAEMGLKKAEIIVSPDIPSPMMTGIFKAHIYLPEMLFTDSQLEMIILHEYQHFKSHDTLVKLFYLALSALFWWNPVVHKFQNRLDHLLELRCDANVTKNMDDAGKERYLSSILAVIKQLHSRVSENSPMASASFVKAGGDDLIKQRFNFVLSYNKKSPIAQAVFMSLLLLLFLSSYMVVVQPAGFPLGDATEAGVSITPENAYILALDDGSMKLYVDGEFFWDVSEADLHDDLHSKLPIQKGNN
jgi:beta-lactamase regulating signal transducer with metallopeptidase domain